MWDFITGYLIGRNLTRKREVEYIQPEPITPIEEFIELPKVIKYVPMPELYDFEATLDKSFIDYDERHLVLICKNGHKYYYLEVEVYETETKWGEQDLLNII